MQRYLPLPSNLNEPIKLTPTNHPPYLHLSPSENRAEVSAPALKVLLNILRNIIQHPLELKYRTINMAGKVFKERCGHVVGVLSLLTSLGTHPVIAHPLIIPYTPLFTHSLLALHTPFYHPLAHPFIILLFIHILVTPLKKHKNTMS